MFPENMPLHLFSLFSSHVSTDPHFITLGIQTIPYPILLIFQKYMNNAYAAAFEAAFFNVCLFMYCRYIAFNESPKICCLHKCCDKRIASMNIRFFLTFMGIAVAEFKTLMKTFKPNLRTIEYQLYLIAFIHFN